MKKILLLALTAILAVSCMEQNEDGYEEVEMSAEEALIRQAMDKAKGDRKRSTIKNLKPMSTTRQSV